MNSHQTFNDNHHPPKQWPTTPDATESNLIALGIVLAQIKQDLDSIVGAWEKVSPLHSATPKAVSNI